MSEVGFTKRVPLREVVAECVQRWFNATLKDAEHGDRVMQSLVGQMYCLGYGVPHDIEKARIWLKKSGATDAEASSLIEALCGTILMATRQITMKSVSICKNNC